MGTLECVQPLLQGTGDFQGAFGPVDELQMPVDPFLGC
jgi:hypothetical protein